jgi:hypothetical protein
MTLKCDLNIFMCQIAFERNQHKLFLSLVSFVQIFAKIMFAANV